MCGLLSTTRKDWRRVWERACVGTDDEVTRRKDLSRAEGLDAPAGSGFLGRGTLISAADDREMS